jgi:hypothetical protein
MTTPTAPRPAQTGWALVAVAWTLVGIPLAWGIYRTLLSAIVLFK